ncbi:GLPGLI family protein [Flavobacterium sp.]|uniref:GLPGLI family protein n=1 Tax=Flavobacterium sp. TaxID=239 RepID=UPI003526F87A
MKHFSIFLFLFFQCLYSQSIEVVYNFIPKEITQTSTNEHVNALIQELDNLNIEFLLKADNAASYFKLIENDLNGQNTKEKLLIKTNVLRIGYMNPYYYSKAENTFYYEKEGFVIKKENGLAPQITKETKKIDNYTCYKAIYKEKIINRIGKEVEREIIAWFTPELPYAYGPLEYNGLPGLILELEKLGCKLVAKSITIDKDKDITIEKPKGKTISENEYKEKIKSKFE